MSETVKCPLCGYAMRTKRGKRGEFLSCLRYPDCKGTRELTTVPGVPEALGAQYLKMSPRVLSVILFEAALLTRDDMDGSDALETALALSSRTMARPAPDPG